MKINLSKNEIVIKLHYNFFNNDVHSINFYTKNACSLAQVKIISYVIRTLYPNEKFEILSLPPQDGSYGDWKIIKFLNNNQGVISVVGVLIPALLFGSQIRLNNTTSDLNILEIVEKCKELGLDDEKIQTVSDICDSYFPKKQKNKFYESVISDSNVTSIKTVVKEDKNSFEKEIYRSDFALYIEDFPKEKEFLRTDLSGHIQLSQPFIDKQQQYGRGAAWKGIYYGGDILDNDGKLLVEDGENVFFYMQDDEYKKQILDQEISFTSGDNIGVVFDISLYYNYTSGKFGKPNLYVKKVVSHNDNLVQHKKDLAIKKDTKKREEKNINQKSLFDVT
ncbi:MAG: hypothetical protein WC682_04645 [Parcubacteria group bacterium]|jgi:hypothetical protein